MSRSSRAAASGIALAAALLLSAIAVSGVPAWFQPRGVQPSGSSPYPEAPPAAHTGGFGEPTCHACHLDYELQPAGDGLEIRGLPATYEPGESYRLTVMVTRADIGNAGFQLAVRFADGQNRGVQAGAIEGDDERTEITVAGTPVVQYLHHTRTGTALTSADTAKWSFTWTAPESDAPVSIDVSANAANDDASELGDYVYVRAVQLTAR